MNMKKILNVIKKIMFSTFLLYGYNLMVYSIGDMIPINIYTVGFISYFGIPMLFVFIFLQKIFF